MKFKSFFLATATALALSAGSALAGPFIISGTDSDEHGFASGGANFDGWLYMQKALENIGGGVTNGSKTVVTFGSTSSALTAANSAFGFSSLVGAGWNIVNLDGVTDITNFFNGTGTTNINNTGIMMIDSGSNVTGGISPLEDAVLTTNAVLINSFVGAGGGLFSQASQLGWLSALVPGIAITPGGAGTGLVLTPDGNTAFPGLTNADISTGPWHAEFGNYSPLFLLAEDTTGRDVIIGAGAGSITDPEPPVGVPEPLTMSLFGAGLVGAAALRRRKAKKV
ncbi:MAG TPA: PEP-CTERM sorting domain-containing protein [Rhizomicrobium sp.]|nr:PEP-CTERM sorting domain-containing protein [Rhizomicrobium sp.]